MAQKPRCTASEPAKYASTRLSSAANSGIACWRGCGTAETRNVVLPARTRIFAFGGIGEIVVRPCAASSASDVD